MNATATTKKRRKRRFVPGALMTMAILLSLFLCGCSAGNEYHMVLNGK